MRTLLLLTVCAMVSACATTSRAKYTREQIEDIEDNVTYLVHVRWKQRQGWAVPLEIQQHVNNLREQGYGYEVHDKLFETFK